MNFSIISNRWIGCCAVIMLSAWGIYAGAGTLYINPGQSIQAAIDAAAAGDQIEVGPGTYTEAINFLGKAIRLYSSGGAAVTILNGTGYYHVVQCVNGEGADTVLEGFTITGGNANGASYPDEHGGGMYNYNSSPTVTHCVFSVNSAQGSGGGMCNNNSSPMMTNCIFTGNQASFAGGAVDNSGGSHAVLIQCFFHDNRASVHGGAIHNNQSSPILTNCTISGNRNDLSDSAGGILNYDNCYPVVINCILWGNTYHQIVDWGGTNCQTTVTFSDVQGGWAGTGNINADPRYVNTAVGDYRLSDGSPCVDAGNNSAVPSGITTDLVGNPRFFDDTGVKDRGAGVAPIVDMGAYERQERSTWPIYNLTQGLGYWSSIQSAINEAVNGDQIEVAPGTYTETINFLGKAIRLYSSGGPGATTIQGTGGHVVNCVNGETAGTVLEGFTITGGLATTIPDMMFGGGMLNDGASPTVINCRFKVNRALYGGGMFNQNSSPTLIGCSFAHNSALLGGGMLNNNSSPTITGCIFDSNITFGGTDGASGSSHGEDGSAGGDGAGMYNNQSPAVVVDCKFVLNMTGVGGSGGDAKAENPGGRGADGGSGGAVYNLDCSPEFTRCVFIANLTGDGGEGGYASSSKTSGDGGDGAGMYNRNASPMIVDCTFTKNSTGFGGFRARWNGSGGYGGDGAGMCNINSSPTIIGCAFTENQTGKGGECARNNGGSGGYSGIGGYGAGIFISSGSPTIIGCVFRSNRTGDGGRAESAQFSPESANHGASGGAGGSGAGIYISGAKANLTVVGCLFDANVTGNGDSGGNGGDSLVAKGGNGGNGGSGGLGACIYNGSSSGAVIKDSVFLRNIGGTGGAGGDRGCGPGGCGTHGDAGISGTSGIANEQFSTAVITNCTFVGNAGFGIIRNLDGSCTVTHSILWDFDLPEIIGELSSFGSMSVTYSDVKGGTGQPWFGEGCIDAYPMFADADGRVLPGSPCIDSGNNDAPNLSGFDYDGYPRILDGDCDGTARVDMGAYEFNYGSRGDLNYNCSVDLPDVLILAESWMTQPDDPTWNRMRDISDPKDERIDLSDFAVMAENWLLDYR